MSNYFDLTEKERQGIVKKAVKETNKEQLYTIEKTGTIYLGKCRSFGCDNEAKEETGYCEECEKLIINN